MLRRLPSAAAAATLRSSRASAAPAALSSRSAAASCSSLLQHSRRSLHIAPARATTASSAPHAQSPNGASDAAASAPAQPPRLQASDLSGVVAELHARGMIHDVTSGGAEISAFLAAQPRVLYAGFDPTAPSLHVGNLLVLMVMRRFQQWGHKPICVVGGATGMIGDPSGRSTERSMMSDAQLQRNIAGITRDIKRFLDFEADSASAAAPVAPAFSRSSLLLDNASWFAPMHVVPFLRDVGRHFRMGTMLSKDSVSSRLQSEQGMSFTEFTYQLLQAYDFAHLHEKHACSIQIGGSDQFGNITAGVELIKRQAAAHRAATAKQDAAPNATAPSAASAESQVFGLTIPLLTTASGAKFGKSAGNAPIWLSAPGPDSDPAHSSSPYALYQFFLSHTADSDLPRFLRLFTDRSLEAIAELERTHLGRDNPTLCRLLAEDVTRIVHGEEGLAAAQAATQALFGATLDSAAALAISQMEGVPTLSLPRSTVVGASIADLATQVGLSKSRKEARRLIAAGGLYLNNEKVTDEAATLQAEQLLGEAATCVMRSGKKKQFVIKAQA